MTDSKHIDVVVVGAGHNGLVSAAYLAKSGLQVLVLEASDKVGGAAATSEFSEGFSVSECAHFLYSLHPTIVKDLQLANHGLSYVATDLKTVALSSEGKHITMAGSEIQGEDVSTEDISNYRRFHTQMKRFSKVLASSFTHRPPRLVDGDMKDKLSLLKLGWNARKMGRQNMLELLRIGAINIYDVLNENFDNQLLKGALSLEAVLGSHTGPRSPNTVLGLLYRRVGETYGFRGPTIPSGGMGNVSNAIASSATSLGAAIRTSSPVERILIRDGKVAGVKLSDGEVINCDRVISNADPKYTFSKLVGYPQLETGFSRRAANIRMKGNTAKLHLALEALPEFTGLNTNDIGNRLVIAPGPDYVENAFNHAKYGEFSEHPIMEISIPTVHDTSLAPTGKHVLSAVVQYAPHNLKQGWSEANEEFTALLLDLLESYAPGIKKLVIASELLTPADIESRFGTTAGHWHHGELALDQFLMLRPFPGMGQYAAPVKGLFLCGAGSHPGGNVMGLVGRNCANTLLEAGAASD